jgi:hypothetical protein
LHRTSPRLVYASGSGYGLTGFDRDNLAMDLTIQAVSRLIAATGFPEGPRRSRRAPRSSDKLTVPPPLEWTRRWRKSDSNRRYRGRCRRSGRHLCLDRADFSASENQEEAIKAVFETSVASRDRRFESSFLQRGV